MNSCYGCKFASKLRENHRKGDQVKCSKATELFGGTHWVNVLRSETGELLPSKCGQFEPGIEPTSEEVLKVKPQEEETYQIDYLFAYVEDEGGEDYRECSSCNGFGYKTNDKNKQLVCRVCNGEGLIFYEDDEEDGS